MVLECLAAAVMEKVRPSYVQRRASRRAAQPIASSPEPVVTRTGAMGASPNSATLVAAVMPAATCAGKSAVVSKLWVFRQHMRSTAARALSRGVRSPDGSRAVDATQTAVSAARSAARSSSMALSRIFPSRPLRFAVGKNEACRYPRNGAWACSPIGRYVNRREAAGAASSSLTASATSPGPRHSLQFE